MLPEEKTKLLALLDKPAHWCQEAEARDASGEAVRYSDPSAEAWDITGAVCLLFGWARASELFLQLDKHILGPRGAFKPRNAEMVSMAALQDYNDSSGTTYQMLVEQLKSMPVWQERHKE